MIFSFFSNKAKEDKIKKIIDDISSLARNSPARFFIKNLEKYKNTSSESTHFDILHDLYSIHLERRGVFEEEFAFINENDNVKNKLHLEVRRIYDCINHRQIRLPDKGFNTEEDIGMTILSLCEKYSKRPEDFFLALGFSKYISAESSDKKSKVINEEFISALNYYGVSFDDILSHKSSLNIYESCINKLIPKIKNKH